MNIRRGSVKLALFGSAWNSYGTLETVKPDAWIPHSHADDVVPLGDRAEPVRDRGVRASAPIEFGNDHRLADPEPLEAILRASHPTASGRIDGEDDFESV
jgi:hypothetical protein